MPCRTKAVSSILALAKQIVRHDEFANDAVLYSDIVRAAGDRDAAVLLRTMAIARKAEVVRMRAMMTNLAGALAVMPITAN